MKKFYLCVVAVLMFSSGTVFAANPEPTEKLTLRHHILGMYVAIQTESPRLQELIKSSKNEEEWKDKEVERWDSLMPKLMAQYDVPSVQILIYGQDGKILASVRGEKSNEKQVRTSMNIALSSAESERIEALVGLPVISFLPRDYKGPLMSCPKLWDAVESNPFASPLKGIPILLQMLVGEIRPDKDGNPYIEPARDKSGDSKRYIRITLDPKDPLLPYISTGSLVTMRFTLDDKPFALLHVNLGGDESWQVRGHGQILCFHSHEQGKSTWFDEIAKK